MSDMVGAVPSRWEHTAWRRGLAASDYQRRFDQLEAAGEDVHGEAAFVASLVRRPGRILDAGCGTGRVATRLTQLGYRVVGLDVDAEMIKVAAERDHLTTFVHGDLARLDLSGPAFAAAVLAGNVVPLLVPGTLATVIGRLANHLETGGLLISGFGLGDGHLPLGCPVTELATYDRSCEAAGLAFLARHGGWEASRYAPGSGYAVSVHRKR